MTSSLSATDRLALDRGDKTYLKVKGANYYCQEDYEQAVLYYQLAAAMGDVDALSNLGYCYLYGRVGEADVSLALAYFELAAKQGHVDALYKLGDIYSRDKWGLKDEERALYYYQLALEEVSGEKLSELSDISWCDHLMFYPSLCFALGRVFLPEGMGPTDLELARQFFELAERGYQRELQQGASFYASALTAVQEYLADPRLAPSQIELDSQETETFPTDRPLSLVEVIFDHYWGQTYSYYSADPSLRPGEGVLVPTPSGTKLAMVKRLYQAWPDDLPFPLSRLKRVLAPYRPFDAVRVQETVDQLTSQGQVLDLSQSATNPSVAGPYDLLKTPFGDFWLSYNDQPIPMTISPLPQLNRVEQGLLIKPSSPDFSEFQSLKLSTTQDLSQAEFEDDVLGELTWGSIWEVEGYHLGIAAKTYLEEEELRDDIFSRMVYYDQWPEDFSDDYGFYLVWKAYESPDDLGVYLAILDAEDEA